MVGMLLRVNKTYCIPIHDKGVYEYPNSKFTVEYTWQSALLALLGLACQYHPDCASSNSSG